MSMPAKSAPTTSSHDDLLVAERERATGGAGAGEKAHAVEREMPLEEDRPHHGADLSRGAEDPDLHARSLVAGLPAPGRA